MYSAIAPMMGLPAARQAQRLCAKDRGSFTYMPGLNNWAFDAASKTRTPCMDSMRVIRAVELYRNNYLIGECFSTDVRLHLTPEELPTAEAWENVQQYVLSVRREGLYAAEAFTFDLVDTIGMLADQLTGLIPEATSEVTSSHI